MMSVIKKITALESEGYLQNYIPGFVRCWVKALATRREYLGLIPKPISWEERVVIRLSSGLHKYNLADMSLPFSTMYKKITK